MDALSLYHCLPPFARRIAASMYGYRLSLWRYGPETDRLVKAARERETWDDSRLASWQQAELAQLLERVAVKVPYYRETWERRRLAGDSRSPVALQHWPVLAKEQVRANPRAFLAEGAARQRLRVDVTSGTTGTPLQIYHTRTTSRGWYALTEARWRGWYGVSRRDRWAILGGQMVTPVGQTRPPYWVWNVGLRQLYLSSYHLSSDRCADYLTALDQHRVVYLWGYASSLASLACFAREQRLTPPQLKVIISNAEPLPAREREIIQEVFRCPVRDTYGMSEMVAAASECEHGTLHLWPEAGIVEVLGDESDEPVPYGTVGRLVCTGLLNQEMPLVRYALGDRGAVAHPSERCACGRTLPILKTVEGRQDDVIITPDQRRIGRLDPVFKVDLPIREAQVIQNSPSSLLVKVVPAAGFGEASRQRIVSALRQRVGEMSIAVEAVDHIPRGKNGKFRAVISMLDPGRPTASMSRSYPGVRSQSRTSSLLQLYHALPPFARNLAASMHGYSLRAARYSRATSKLVEEALVRESWPASTWESWQAERLRETLRRAALEVPYYRQIWDERKRRGERASFEVLAHWPILTKERLRMHPERFLAEAADPRRLHAESTSGTTGTPLKLWRGRDSIRQWYALNEARVKRWHGLEHKTRWAHIGGQPVVPYGQEKPPYWVWNGAMNQLCLSSMHVSPQSCLAYLAALRDYRIEFLLGYASSIALLAQVALENCLELPLRLVVTDSEPLFEHQRRCITRAFRCPVRSTYGMTELACAASECSAGSLHLWPEVGVVELLDEHDQPVAPGQTGRIVATGLLNLAMPLIRYDTQDLAQADPDGQPCPCGRTLPRLKEVLGRNDDVLIAQDGRRLVQVDRILGPEFDLREAQIVQEAIGRFLIRIVPGTGWTSTSGRALCDALGQLVGEAEIRLEVVERIERTWAGKHRVIISNLPAARSSGSEI